MTDPTGVPTVDGDDRIGQLHPPMRKERAVRRALTALAVVAVAVVALWCLWWAFSSDYVA